MAETSQSNPLMILKALDGFLKGPLELIVYGRSALVALDVFDFARLHLKRPSTHDLILTKMMRVDPQDRQDIEFLIQQRDFNATDFAECLRAAICPDIPEIQAAFCKNRVWLRSLGMG